MEKVKILIKKIIFGSLFCVILPALLIIWATQTEPLIKLQVPDYPTVSLSILILGIVLIISGMLNLWFKGRGLPMSAFPPKKYVSTGAYFFFHHPIYVGVVLASFGLSAYLQSAAGFWLISPIFILLIWAYVNGFEREIISQNFDNQSHRTFFDFPENSTEKLSLKNKLLMYIWIFLPWFLIYESFIFFGVPPDAIDTHIFLDDFIPLIETSVIPYVSAYLLVLLIPFTIENNQTARMFLFDAIVGMAFGFYCYLAFPFIVDYQPIENKNFFTELIILGRKTDGQTAALPSFHVFWALMFYKYFSLRFPKIRTLFLLIAISIIISCLTTHSHTILDVTFGISTFYIAIFRREIYQKLLLFCEKISNSWKEWRFGKIRIINHGFYAALGGVSGFLIIGYFLPNHLYVVHLIGIAGFVGAGLWAQFIEGSPQLLRPYGYYGSVVGIALTIILIAIFSEIGIWQLLGVATLGASSIQFFGRFRCLVQGCCHGKPTEKVLGLHFNHPKSRVNKIAGWAGKNLYPTQFYSIASNFLTFFLLFRLVSLEMPASFVAGMYLIFNGSFRFVEESLRGEPQTEYFMQMRVYQWFALVSVIIGIALTCIESTPLPIGNFDFKLVIHSIFYGFIILFAYGIDFPESNKRFSRLTQ